MRFCALCALTPWCIVQFFRNVAGRFSCKHSPAGESWHRLRWTGFKPKMDTTMFFILGQVLVVLIFVNIAEALFNSFLVHLVRTAFCCYCCCYDSYIRYSIYLSMFSSVSADLLHSYDQHETMRPCIIIRWSAKIQYTMLWNNNKNKNRMTQK